MNYKTWYALLVLSASVLDRYTKLWALSACIKPWYINTFLSCEVMLNRGVSWSFFNFADETRFFILTTIIIGITGVLIAHTWRQYRLGESIIGELLIITGSLSNIVDRIIYGGVIDFLLLSYGTWSWPVFNVADMCIVSGVFLMFLKLYKK